MVEVVNQVVFRIELHRVSNWCEQLALERPLSHWGTTFIQQFYQAGMFALEAAVVNDIQLFQGMIGEDESIGIIVVKDGDFDFVQ